jgi:glycosyltransferase involved in cell wall biosynthesis
MDLSQYSRMTSGVLKMLICSSRFPDAIVTNSQAGQEFHVKLGYKPQRWLLIPNGIDTSLFQPNREIGQKLRHSLGIPDEATVIGMLGRVDPMKDYTTFLKAIEILSQTHENLYCIVAGKGTENADWPVVPPRLLRLGICKNVPEFLNFLDIMVLSSAFGEGFPNVVGEAMACGIPTIVTDVGDAATLVQTETQIVSPQTVDELILALKGLLALSSQERRAIGQQGRERILSSYSLPTMRQRYALFYKGLLN